MRRISVFQDTGTRKLAEEIRPANAGASPEARRLLAGLYALSGRRTLAGQHNAPCHRSRWSQRVAMLTGRRPALWGQDLGFSQPNTLDGINFRAQTIREAIRQHRRGAIICLSWHAVCPADEEPVTFTGSIRKQLSDTQWRDILTPGTDLHSRWLRQVDEAAFWLAKLREKHIPVLWRPYHEMNGDWFWWAARPGAAEYQQLWRNLFERLTLHHQLGNLVWVWNPNGVYHSAAPYEGFFPGHEWVDVLAIDVYHRQYEDIHYQELKSLAQGKPLALGEVGELPDPEILARQPGWVWFMTWGTFLTRNNSVREVRKLYADPRVVSFGAGKGKK